MRRFATDATLGKLGRFLRSAGFDTLCQHQSRSPLFFDSLDRGRIVLTRTRALLDRLKNRPVVFIRDNDPWQQINQVVSELGIRQDEAHSFSRCLACNLVLQQIDKNGIVGRVPAYVWQHHNTFHACDGCRRIYWPGSHHDRMRQRIDGLFQPKDAQFHAGKSI